MKEVHLESQQSLKQTPISPSQPQLPKDDSKTSVTSTSPSKNTNISKSTF
jgi:hypothetical protein